MEGIKVYRENINNIKYAYDTALVAGSESKLQDSVDKIVTESEKLGTLLNAEKTYCPITSKKKEAPKCQLIGNGQAIRQVKQFSYLGNIITNDGRCDTEIKGKIGVAKKAFQDLANILTKRRVKLDTRQRILNSNVWSVLVYGETWTISKNVEETLKSLELWFFRRMLRVSW